MKPRDKRAWKPGQAVTLRRPVAGRYSGYARYPSFTAPAGTRAIVRSGPHPAVRGNGRDFYIADVPGWAEGAALWNGDAAAEVTP